MNTRPERLNTVERCALWPRLVEFTCAAAVLATLIACNHAAYAEEHPVDTPEIVAQVITPPLPQSVLREFRVPKLKRKLSGRLAFSSRIGGLNRILVVDLGSRKVRSLISGPGNSTYPAWSPDGNWLAFTSDRSGANEIYISDWEGNQQRALTAESTRSDHSDWSPDGREVLYYSQDQTGAQNFFTTNVSTGSVRRITSFGGKNSTARWAPNGSLIAYSTNRNWPGWDVCVWNNATLNENCLLQGTNSFCRPAWSHSGNHLAYSYGNHSEIDIGILDYRSRQVEQLTKLPGREYDATWSPDDRFIAFVSEADAGDGVFNIRISDVASGDSFPVLNSPHSIRYLSWSKVSTLELEAKRIREREKALLSKTPLDPRPNLDPLATPPKDYKPPYLRQ